MHHSLARLALVLLSLVGAAFSAGCGDEAAAAAARANGGDHVTINAILGKWRLTKGSLGVLARDGYVGPDGLAYTIDFGKDGFLKFESVLDDVRGGTYVNCLGTWRLRHEVVVNGEQQPNVVELQLLRPNSRYFLKLSVLNDHGNLRLCNAYGESRTGEQMEYERPDAKRVLSW
jgi:hypothetical protein